jgi:calcineurin-like phosphoesterase family protein
MSIIPLRKFLEYTATMAYWFTADTHFGHANIIRHCSRPWTSVKDMDDALLDSINRSVRESDVLFHLGDFCYRPDLAEDYRSRIRCRNIVLVPGNHDPSYPSQNSAAKMFFSLFSEVSPLLERRIQVAGRHQPVFLCHYAMRCWNKSHYGSWHLFGHSHGRLPDDPQALSWDVGVDNNGYRPLSVEQVQEIMSKKDFKPFKKERTP